MNADSKLIMIFTHQILMPTTPRDSSAEWSVWMVRNHEKVRQMLGRYPNVRLVVSGHHHASSVVTAGNITYVSDPAIVTFPCSFRFFTVTKEGIHLKNIGIEDKNSVNRTVGVASRFLTYSNFHTVILTFHFFEICLV